MSTPPPPAPAAPAAPVPQATTRPQSERLRSLWLLAGVMAFGLLGWLLGGRDLAELLAAVSAIAGLLALALHERHLLRRLASGTEAIAAIDLPMLILDARDRVRWASAAFVRLYPGLGQVPVGLPYPELKRRVLATGALALAPHEHETWLAQRLRDHAGAGHVRLQKMASGRTVQVVERRTGLGGWTSVAFDVTELLSTQQAAQQAGEQAQAAQALLEDALEALPAAFEIWDRDDRLLRCNRRLLDLHPDIAQWLTPGVHFDTVVRTLLDQGAIPEARGREMAWLSERLAQRGQPGRPFIESVGPRWLQVEERRTRGGHLVGIRQDVTELVEARRALSQAQARLERQHRLLGHAVDALPMAVEVYDEQGRLQWVNRTRRSWHPEIDYDALIGLGFEQLLRISLARGLLPLEAQADPEAWIAERLLRQARADGQPLLQQLPDGRQIVTQETRTPEGQLLITRQDVTAQVQKEQTLQALVDTAGAGIVTLDAKGLLRSMNRAALSIWGYSEQDAPLGRPGRELLDGDDGLLLAALFERHRGGDDVQLIGAQREFRARRRDGSLRVVLAAMSEAQVPGGPLYVGVVHDVTEQRAAEAQLREANARLEQLSSTDSLTGLANRRALMERLQQAWLRAQREQGQLAVLLIDVDHFKRYNDHHGHQAGDAALREVAQQLAAVARRGSDLAARYGGEEFVLLLEQVDAEGAWARAERLLQALRERALPHGAAPSGRVSASVGVAWARPGRHDDAAQLLKRADEALYRAKAAGRDRAERAPDVSGEPTP